MSVGKPCACLACQKMKLLPDLHITRDGVLRIRLGAHQEHQVNHVARATDRTKVSAAVIQLASHEDAPLQDMSEGDAKRLGTE